MNWSIAKIGEICKIYAGGDKPQNVSSEKNSINKYPIFSNGIENEGLYGFTDKYQFEGNAITITGRGANAGTVFFRKNAFLPIIRLLTLIPDSNIINSQYLYYLIKDRKFLSTGAAQPQITVPNIANVEIKYHTNLEIQQRIALVLSAYDDLIENNQKQIKLLEEAAQRLYKEWFVDLRFPGYETTPITDGIPAGWKSTNINAVMTFHRGYDLTKNNMVHGKYPVVGSTSIIGYHNQYKINGPGIVTGRSGSLGEYQLIWEDYWPHNTSLYVSDMKGHHVLYLYSMLQTVDFSGMNNGGAIPTLNRNTLSNIPVIEAPKVLQDEYVRIVEPIYSAIRNAKIQIKYLQEIRDRLLPELMTGEIEV